MNKWLHLDTLDLRAPLLLALSYEAINKMIRNIYLGSLLEHCLLLAAPSFSLVHIVEKTHQITNIGLHQGTACSAQY